LSNTVYVTTDKGISVRLSWSKAPKRAHLFPCTFAVIRRLTDKTIEKTKSQTLANLADQQRSENWTTEHENTCTKKEAEMNFLRKVKAVSL